MSKRILGIGFLILFNCALFAQQDFSILNPVSNNKYKKVLKKAKEEGKLALFICHSAQVVSNSIFLADGPTIEELSEHIVTAVVDWNVDTRNKIWDRVEIKTNPHYVFIHADDVIINSRREINSNDDLVQFYGEALSITKKYEKLSKLIREGENPAAYKSLASLFLTNGEKFKAKQLIEDWIQETEPLRSDEDLEFLAAAHLNCMCSNRMDIAMGQYEGQIKSLIGVKPYLDIRQAFILNNLTEVGLLEPFYVWESFDANLGVHADSLYRLFAIEYFKSILPDKQVMLDEIYNFLYYYPKSPWKEQKELFAVAVKETSDLDDWSLLLDLIEFQILEDNSYEKKDIKSVILYKMGNKDRALELMNEAEGEAIQVDPDFTPMLFKFMGK